MLEFLKKSLFNETNIINKILLTVLLIIISTYGIIGLFVLNDENQDKSEMNAISNFEIMLERDAPASGIEEAEYIQNVKDDEEEIILED